MLFFSKGNNSLLTDILPSVSAEKVFVISSQQPMSYFHHTPRDLSYYQNGVSRNLQRKE